MAQPTHHEVISVRALSRNVAEILDRVEMERQKLLVTRNSRPVAFLAPLSSRQDSNAQPVVAVLTPVQERILLKAAGRAPQVTASFEDLGNARELSRALMHLEFDGLLKHDFGGYTITEEGALVGAVLQARADA